MKDFFEFNDILNTQMYLSTYYRLLAPLGFRGIDIAQRRYREMLSNMTTGTHHLFNDIVQKHYGHDITLDSLGPLSAKPYVNNTLTGVVFPPFMHHNHSSTVNNGLGDATSVYTSDARTHMVIDRIVNNIRHIQVLDSSTHNKNNSVVMRFAYINQQMGSALSEAFNDDLFKNAAPHIINFTKDANVLDKGLVGIVNLIRTFMTLSEQVLGHALEAIIHLLPHYWNLATGITMLPLKIPFVYEWYTEKFTRGQSDLTLTDLLTLLGGTVATWTYKLYNDNLPPYTSIDVDVLRTNTEPELILYTWGHDPRTSDTNDNVTHTHRLGMHDWIPRTHWATVTSLTTILYDVSMAAYKMDVRNPGPYTHLPQMFGTLAGVMGRVGYYPFTQLNTSEPERVKNSKRNPDGKRSLWVFIH
jgi:hypothetical protein